MELRRLGVDIVSRRGGLPRRAADIDAATMGRIIRRQVDAVRPLDGTTGTTDRARLSLVGDGLPESVFVKSAATAPATRLFGGLARLGEVEVGFYRDLRPALGLDVPTAHGAVFGRGTGRFALVLEDLALRGAEFTDTLTPFTLDQVAGALSTLAALHGATHARGTYLAWLGTNAGDPLLPLVTAAMGPLVRRVARHDESTVPPSAVRLLRSYRRWAHLLDQGPRCVLHGDPHPGNVYLYDGRVGLLDWQAVRLGNPQRDATYFLVLALPGDVRRRHERDLLDHYRAELAGAGGPVRTADETWHEHRRMAAYAYLATVFTFGLGGLQGADVADVGLRRAAEAIADLDTARILAVG